MRQHGRRAAIGGLLAMALMTAACGDSPNEPSRFPQTVQITSGETMTVTGSNLVLRLEPLGPCPPNASCLAGPRARLTARVGGAAPVDVSLAYPFGGPSIPQAVDGYTVTLQSFTEEADGRVRVVLIVDRHANRAPATA